MFWYAKSLTSDSIIPAQPMELLDGTVKRRAPIVLDASGKVKQAVPEDTEIYGILETVLIKKDSETAYFGDVRTSRDAVYEVPYEGTAPVKGTAIGFKVTAGGDYILDTAATAKPFTVRDVLTKRNVAYVSIT